MLRINHDGPAPTIADVIRFLQTLPPGMVCTRHSIVFEPRSISMTNIDSCVSAYGGTDVHRIELTIEPAV